jgi:glycosyltransferase involved in cell wall biosynthesis
MKQALVSICLPTYNRAAYLRTAIASALAQTYRNFELCIFDNASGDETAHVVAAAGDSRIRYIRRAANLGLTANWMQGLQEVSGEYCAILGDDDRLEPAFLEMLVAPLETNREIDIAFCDHWLVDGQGEVLAGLSDSYSRAYKRASLRPGLHRPFRSLVLSDQAILINASVIRRERLLSSGALDPRSGRVLDYYMLARLAQLGGGAFFVQDRLYSYRQHSGSMTTMQPVEIWRDMQWVCADLLRTAPRGEEAATIRRKWAQAIVNEGAASTGTGRARQLATTWARSWNQVPMSARVPVTGLVLIEILRRGIRRSTAAPVNRGVSRAHP